MAKSLIKSSSKTIKSEHKDRTAANTQGNRFGMKSHNDVKVYLAQLQDGSPGRKKEAKNALIRSGVLNKNGNMKDVIVSWE